MKGGWQLGKSTLVGHARHRHASEKKILAPVAGI